MVAVGAGAQEDCQEKNQEGWLVVGLEGITGEAGGTGSQGMGHRGNLEVEESAPGLEIEEGRGLQGYQDLEQRETAGHQEADDQLDTRGCIPAYLMQDGDANHPERRKINHLKRYELTACHNNAYNLDNLL